MDFLLKIQANDKEKQKILSEFAKDLKPEK
jgi:hypothetical protein